MILDSDTTEEATDDNPATRTRGTRPDAREPARSRAAGPRPGSGVRALRPASPDLHNVAVPAVHAVGHVHRRAGRGRALHLGAAHRDGPAAALPRGVRQI